MSDFDLYRLFKLLHVLAAMGLASGIVIEALVGSMMPRAKSVAELRVLARVSKAVEVFVFPPALLFIPVFGYLTADRIHLDTGVTWLAVAQGLFYIAALLTLVIERPASLKLSRALEGVPDGPVPPDVQRMVKNPLPALVGMLLSLIFVFVAYLMVAKPAL